MPLISPTIRPLKHEIHTIRNAKGEGGATKYLLCCDVAIL